MKIYIDSDTNTLIGDPNFKVPLQGVTFKRGDSATVEIIFVTGFVPLSAVGGIDLIFGAKMPGVFDGDAIVYEDNYTTSGNSYVMKPSFNTVEIDGLLGSGNLSAADVASLTLSLEITWSTNGGTDWASSNIIPLVINNDILKGLEGTPLALSANATTWLEDDAQPRYITFENGTVSLNANNSIHIGLSAGDGTTLDDSSIFIGKDAGQHADNAANSIFFGEGAGYTATGSSNSIFLGYLAGYASNGSNYNVCIGDFSASNGKNLQSCNFIGRRTGFQSLSTSNSNYFGNYAGKNIVTGNRNLCLGNESGADSTSLSAISGCIVIGDNAKATGNNQLVLGSTTAPLTLLAGESLVMAAAGLSVIINGSAYTIPLLSST